MRGTTSEARWGHARGECTDPTASMEAASMYSTHWGRFSSRKRTGNLLCGVPGQILELAAMTQNIHMCI
ncbi:hypothetical protein AGIG_G17746 [Arapaima gigas]